MITLPKISRAPKFKPGLTWFNVEKKIPWEDLKGCVVVLDFWTYCCINCIHVLPHLKKLEEQYAGKPVVFIGAHCAKFQSETVDAHIQSAIDRYEITHPVVSDPEHHIWQEYCVNAWPTFVVVDGEGYIRLKVSGEGQEGLLDQAIEGLLREDSTSATKISKKIKGLDSRLHGNDTPSSSQALKFPGKITLNSSGDELFISDSNHHRIVHTILTSPKEGKVQQVIGSGVEGFKDGNFETAQFRKPQGICLVGQKLFICDTENHALRMADLERKQVITLAGTGKQARFGARGGDHPLNVDLNSPWDVVHSEGSLFIAMAGSHQVWRYEIANDRIEVFAGTGEENIYDDHREEALLAQPSGVSIDQGRLYFVDSETSSLRMMDMVSGDIETLVGQGLFVFGHQDGSSDEALLQHPLGVCGSGDYVFVADTYNHAVRVYDWEQDEVFTLIAGEREKGICSIEGEACSELSLFEPNDVVRHEKYLYIADTNNHLIRVYDIEENVLGEFKIS